MDQPIDTSPRAEQFGSYDPDSLTYRGLDIRSCYVEMRDGVRLAVDVILPRNLPAQEQIPTLLVQSRYWRTLELRAPFKWFLRAEDLNVHFRKQQPYFSSHGYAIVLVDVRGTGASFGSCPYPWHRATLADARQIVDWIIVQPWSNGRVGAYGISYLGTTAEMLTAIDHPAVMAVIPMFNHPDAFTDISFPGGLLNDRFIKTWGYFDRTLDSNKMPAEFGLLGKLLFAGVKPVDEDRDRRLLHNAVRDHTRNNNTYQLATKVTFRDERNPVIAVSVDEITVHHYQGVVSRTKAATCGWASWMDAGTADAAIRRFMTYESARQAVIGAWEHGGRFNASPYRSADSPANPPLATQWREMLRFFDAYLKDEGAGMPPGKMLYYYTMGEEKWKKTSVWPPHGTSLQSLYLREDHKLSPSLPVGEDAGFDKYQVDFQATSGIFNRWWEMGALENKSITYPNRAEQDEKLLVYTSEPLEKDLEITGYPVVSLYLSSNTTDGAVYVYLEDVAENGHVFYITEGQLRLLHRKISPPGDSPYCLLVPYHSFKEEDAWPMLPGEVTEIKFGLQPTSVLVREGHRIRVAIAGHDRGTFARLPAEGEVELSVYRQERLASRIDLPVVDRAVRSQ